MPRRPASCTQADVARVIRAAKQEGATAVEVRVGNTTMVVRLTEPVAGSSVDSDARCAAYDGVSL